MRRLSATAYRWPLARPFTISRGATTEVGLVMAVIEDDDTGGRQVRGRGECRPYARYGETVERTLAEIEVMAAPIAAGLTRDGLLAAMPPGAARNAIDCALWDLEAKLAGDPAHRLAGLPAPRPLTTACTISLDTPDAMAAEAVARAAYPLLKLKLGGDGDAERLATVRRARPDARLIVDANEAWPEAMLDTLLGTAATLGVEVVEQPLPAGRDEALARISRPLPVCADESAHARDGLAALTGRYDAVNIKLDKTGGLTEALAMAADARRLGFRIMAGCMMASSLSMAPAMLLAGTADWVDLDGPILMAKDHAPPIRYDGALMFPPEPSLWG
ncbi:MAG: N-acetyl-D-Glu racemase DgcA [Hyphomicrobiaceae bacterium]